MHILRSAAPIVKYVAGLQSDLIGIVGKRYTHLLIIDTTPPLLLIVFLLIYLHYYLDDWGTGFVDELNYEKEGDCLLSFPLSIYILQQV